jgi:Uma2 family endonuclease
MLTVLEQPSFRERALPISVSSYHVLTERGLIDPRSELIRGVIVKKRSKSPLHSIITDQLLEIAKLALPECWVRQEAPLTFLDSEPEPDISVVPGCRRDYLGGHPTTAPLVIEVAVSSVGIDREKGLVYAEAGVAEYWLVLVEQEIVEVHTGPSSTGWIQVRRRTREETLTSQTYPRLSVSLAELFPSVAAGE